MDTEGSLQIKLLDVEGTFLETELCESEQLDGLDDTHAVWKGS